MPANQTDPAARAATLAAALAGLAAGPVTADAELTALGLDSLALVRVVIEVLGDDPDAEVDLGRIGDLRTVGDLHAWLAGDPSQPQVVR
jgi:acyl carrier protein